MQRTKSSKDRELLATVSLLPEARAIFNHIVRSCNGTENAIPQSQLFQVPKAGLPFTVTKKAVEFQLFDLGYNDHHILSAILAVDAGEDLSFEEFFMTL
eukprot:2905418-Rhodomonas_salina.2